MARPRQAWSPHDRDGLGASRVAVSAGPPLRVADFLARRLPRVGDWAERLARGEVLDADGRPVDPAALCRHGSVLWYWREQPDEPVIPFELELLHQDEHLVVVDKPHFLPVTPGGRWVRQTALVRLKQQLGIATLAPMHRLDLETAGVLVFMVQPDTRNAYQALLREQRVHKVYEAVAPWREGLALPLTARHRLQDRDDEAFMQVQVVEGEPNAQTRVELISRLGPGGTGPQAHYRLLPAGGRRHQLRAQMNALGLPIASDRIYPVLQPAPAPGAAPDWSLPLQLLAREIAFDDPMTGQPRRFVSRCRLAGLAAHPGREAANAGMDVSREANGPPGPGGSYDARPSRPAG
jgi:tRNA pseudouridine32 synthase/23S rRNA pseudouridine746 synthase